MKTPIHNNYDDEYQDQEEEDEFVDSCSCTDVTLDETLKINHNHRKSMARKKKLQTQRLRELQKVEKTTNNNSELKIEIQKFSRTKNAFFGSFKSTKTHFWRFQKLQNPFFAFKKSLKSCNFGTKK